jgi:hypothetical protein
VNQRLTWKLRRTDRHGVERLRVGGTTLSLICEKRESADAPAKITLEADKAFTVELVHPKARKVVRLSPGKPLRVTVK